MSLMGSLNVSASGMSAQRTRMDIISQNIANVNTTTTAATIAPIKIPFLHFPFHTNIRLLISSFSI